ncbi:hypothetical protein BGW37DRAFT_499092 [Umbelopsis sp. PMI_123]|nr:hypothetical protein BGW37DRAFT_499092 [Umbelopsis sp. PMI_123]
MDDPRFSTKRIHRAKQDRYFTESNSCRSDVLDSNAYWHTRKRTPTLSSNYDSYCNNISTRPASKLSRASFENMHLCCNCSRSSSRAGFPTQNQSDDDAQDNNISSPLMFAKKLSPKIDGFQNNEVNEITFKKRVRFQLSPSKSSPNFRKKEDEASHNVPVLQHQRSRTRSERKFSRDTDYMAKSNGKKSIPLTDNSYLNINEVKFHEPNNSLKPEYEWSISPRYYKNTDHNLSNSKSGYQDNYHTSESDLGSDRDRDRDTYNDEHSLRTRTRTVYESLLQPDGVRRREPVDLAKIPSRLPRPIQKVQEIIPSLSDVNDHNDGSNSKRATYHKGKTFIKDNVNAADNEPATGFQRSHSSAGTYRKFIEENDVCRRPWNQSSRSTKNTRRRVLREEISSTDSFEEEDGFELQTSPVAKNLLQHKRTLPEIKRNPKLTREKERYPLDLSSSESDDDDYSTDYNKHILKTRHPPSHRIFLDSASGNKKHGKAINPKDTISSPTEAHYNSKWWNHNDFGPGDFVEHNIRIAPPHLQARTAVANFEQDHEHIRSTSQIEKSRKITRMSETNKPMREHGWNEELERSNQTPQKSTSKSDLIAEHSGLEFTKYDLMMLKQTEDTHRMFMEIWLPPRASGRTYSKLKRSIWDTPTHLLVLKQMHTCRV